MKNDTTVWFLHGGVGMALDWRLPTKIVAAAGYATRAVDLWRFHDCQSLSLPEAAAALNAEVAACGGRHVLVGYSLGGRIALHALTSEASPWCGGVVVSAHPGLLYEEERRKRRVSDAEWSMRCLHEPWDEFIAAWAAQDVLQCATIAGWGDRRNLEPRKGAVARSFLQWSLGTQADLRGALALVAEPILWLTGERDQKFTEIAAEVCSPPQQMRHEVFSDCGHRLPWEKSEEFAARVIAFCDEILTSS